MWRQEWLVLGLISKIKPQQPTNQNQTNKQKHHYILWLVGDFSAWALALNGTEQTQGWDQRPLLKILQSFGASFKIWLNSLDECPANCSLGCRDGYTHLRVNIHIWGLSCVRQTFWGIFQMVTVFDKNRSYLWRFLLL